jgi:hypothetical protein
MLQSTTTTETAFAESKVAKWKPVIARTSLTFVDSVSFDFIGDQYRTTLRNLMCHHLRTS